MLLFFTYVMLQLFHGIRIISLQTSLVLLRIPKSCKRTDSDGFVKKSADPDSVSDS